MRKKFVCPRPVLLILIILWGCKEVKEQELIQPNILWLTCEDMSPRLACYGDSTVGTPNINRLAEEGMRFSQVFSISSVCAPSRSSLITGCYATSIGTMHQRTTTSGNINPFCDPYLAVPPREVKGFPGFLRKAGYYCTNNSKTDYQFGKPFTIWDESSSSAHWRNRPDEKTPFFAVFNCGITHTGNLLRKEAGYTDRDKVPLPPYYADHPDIRKEVAVQYDNILRLDRWMGELLKQLDEDGLKDNTAVFFFSDHGTGLERGKRWMYDSGIRVPMIIRWPGKLEPGSVNNELISFIDLAPTILSLAGVEIPGYIQGRVFLGDQKQPEPDYIFAARDRLDEGYDKVRIARDRRFKYIRNFIPQISYITPSRYRENLLIFKTMKELYRKGELNEVQAAWLQPVKPPEELYEIQKDPHEIKNLAGDPEYLSELERFRSAMVKWRVETKDMGDMPESIMRTMMWPDGIQPLTLPPVWRMTGDESASFVTLTCPTPGASIGYRIIGETGNERWMIYKDPVKVSPGDTLKSKAIRYGYLESHEITVSPE